MATAKKFSRKREAILTCLHGTTCHPTAEWVYQQLKPQFPDLSLGTVYRNLAAFKAEGVIDSVGVVNGLERYDGNTIPPEELPLVFDRFHKLDKSRSQNRDGWGLGLYIVKTIVCSHGEDISVSSKDGKTEFTFTMPLVN